VAGEPVWSRRGEDRPRANAWRIGERVGELLERLRPRLAEGAEAKERDLALYEDAALLLLYQRYYPKFLEASLAAGEPATRWRFYRDFLQDWRRLFHIEGVRLPTGHDPRHTFACFRQIQRAFEQVFQDIIGGSMPAARLRASIWQSIFTHDMRRYRRTLYARMGEFATLITGPSGTGKELVARAIAQSRYAPFDADRLAFPGEDAPAFFPINISALSPTLVESELFGHRRGAFTGAVADRKGYLETCPELGSVFLDELGDLDPAIQVKLLRVIETRTFHPVGDTAGRQFRGKLITATNRDLPSAMRQGRFREDLYYRLCSDQITTPSLAEQLADAPGLLRELIVYMARRVAGAEAEELAAEVEEWIDANLGVSYPWPGNFRELEQCVKNVLIRRNYRPTGAGSENPIEEFARDAGAGRLTADALLRRYVTLVYSQTGSYEETARRLGMDRRTVKGKLDAALLLRLKASGCAG
jgi:transcriptional regulator with AAA-type ATPase domain